MQRDVFLFCKRMAEWGIPYPLFLVVYMFYAEKFGAKMLNVSSISCCVILIFLQKENV